jgi:hypothetical protein
VFSFTIIKTHAQCVISISIENRHETSRPIHTVRPIEPFVHGQPFAPLQVFEVGLFMARSALPDHLQIRSRPIRSSSCTPHDFEVQVRTVFTAQTIAEVSCGKPGSFGNALRGFTYSPLTDYCITASVFREADRAYAGTAGPPQEESRE